MHLFTTFNLESIDDEQVIIKENLAVLENSGMYWLMIKHLLDLFSKKFESLTPCSESFIFKDISCINENVGLNDRRDTKRILGNFFLA